jgi:CspA family cold shock protein
VGSQNDVKGNTMSDAMQAGTVKFFNTTKGFGFIQPDAGGDDVFVHITALQRGGLQGLNEGDKVTFDTAKNERTGKTAVENISMA